MKHTVLIWDFNGTILDDLGICLESVNLLLSRRGLPTLPDADAYRAVFGFPVSDYYRRAGFDLEKENFDDVAHEWMAEYLKRESLAPVFPRALACLGQAKERGIPQILLSATEESMLLRQVSDLGICEYFDTILGMNNIYAGGKMVLAQKWRQAHPDEKVLFVGDTDHDFEVATSVGADCVLFAGGHQTAGTLLKCGCPVVEDLSEVFLHY